MLDLSGVIVPLCTPFNDENQEVDYEGFAQNIQAYNSIPFSGYFVNGSCGEFPHLSSEEQLECLRICKTFSSKPVLAGVACEGERETVRAVLKVSSEGADAAVVLTPFYFKGGVPVCAQVEYFRRVADASPIPVMLYSNPPSTCFDIPEDVVVQLASHNNIIALKDSGCNVKKLASIIHRTRTENFQVFAGSEAVLLPAVAVGCSGAVSGMAGFLGSPVCELFALCKDGQWDKARELQGSLLEMGDMVVSFFPISAIKYGLDLMKLRGGAPRRPLQPLSPEQKAAMGRKARELGFL